MLPKSIEGLIEEFEEFPTVGRRTALRFALHLTKMTVREFENFLEAIRNVRQKIRLCVFCFKPFEPEEKAQNLCEICANRGRDRKTLCVVEKESDLDAIEKTNKFRGLYFILGGALSELKKEEFKKLRFDELKARVRYPEKFGLHQARIQEVIIATNPTTEGEATRMYLERILKGSSKKITHLARGLPIGGEIEYADQETISLALEGKR